MPMVQAEILRAVSGLDDSLGISTLMPDARAVGLCDRKNAARYRLLPHPSASHRRISGLLINLLSLLQEDPRPERTTT
jgi:hypothetical protein